MPIQDSQYHIIQRYHNSTVGHLGVEKTYQKMLSDAIVPAWTGMHSDIEQFVKKECTISQKISVINPMNSIEPFTLASYKPMQRIAMDMT
jgi:hypothetical protein